MHRTKASFVSRFVELDPSDTCPLYSQIYNGLREGIQDGVFLPGTRLPSTRQLAEALDVSRNTVIEAFDELHSEGYLASQVGAGTYVAENLPEQHTQARLPEAGVPYPPPAPWRFLTLIAGPFPFRSGRRS